MKKMFASNRGSQPRLGFDQDAEKRICHVSEASLDFLIKEQKDRFFYSR